MINRVETTKNKNKSLLIWRLFFIVSFAIVLALIVILFINKFDLISKINSVEKIQNLVERGGMFSFIIYMLIQILQTTILQIPSFIVIVAGVVIFGGIKTFILSFISIMIGSILMFFMGRIFGKKLLIFFAGEKKSNYMMELISNGKYLYFLMMLFPLFPDDILCLVAGVGNMSFNYFFWTNMITRAIGIACTILLATGKIIPFKITSIPIWICLGIVILSLFYLSIKYRENIDKMLIKFKKNKY